MRNTWLKAPSPSKVTFTFNGSGAGVPDWRPNSEVAKDAIDSYWRRRAEIEAASKIGDENAEAAAAATKEAKEKATCEANENKGKQQGKKGRGKR